MPESHLFIGLMSGTSLDGVDAVLAGFDAPAPALRAHSHHDFAPELRAELLRLSSPGNDEAHRAAIAAQHLARSYASAIEDLLLHAQVDAAAVRAIGVHGQTVRHRPDAGYTIQLNAPAVLAELTGIDVVADFRSADLAAGGQGAPLVPALHAAVLATTSARAVVNIGGISNLTGLPARGSDEPVIGFDGTWASRSTATAAGPRADGSTWSCCAICSPSRIWRSRRRRAPAATCSTTSGCGIGWPIAPSTRSMCRQR